MSLHTRDDIEWLYGSRNGGKEHSSIEDRIDTSIRRLKFYLKKAKKV